MTEVPNEKLEEWASDFESAAREIKDSGIPWAHLKATILFTRANEIRKLMKGRPS